MQIAGMKRPEGTARQVREKNLVPGVVYGGGVATEHVALEYMPFSRLYAAAGESTLVDLVIDNAEPRKVLIQDIQADPLSGKYVHVDFYQVDMNKKMTVSIPLHFVGVAPAVKQLGGVMIRNIDSVEVECLPAHLVHEIDVDLSTLSEYGSSVHVSDIQVPEGMTILDRPERGVVTVVAPRTEAAVAEAGEDEKEDVTAVEVEEKGKEKEDGGEDGDEKEGREEKEEKKKKE
jgi:large subunit ribosomal protein L25